MSHGEEIKIHLNHMATSVKVHRMTTRSKKRDASKAEIK